MLKLHKIGVSCSCVPNCFYFVLQAKFFSAFSRLDPFPQVFRQVKESLILQLHEMKRMLQVVACPTVFILFYDQYWQGGVLKLMKNDRFLVFLAVLVFFPRF